jgi:hypothetical protein
MSSGQANVDQRDIRHGAAQRVEGLGAVGRHPQRDDRRARACASARAAAPALVLGNEEEREARDRRWQNGRRHEKKEAPAERLGFHVKAERAFPGMR